MSEEEQCSEIEKEPTSETEEQSFDGFDENVFNLRYRTESEERLGISFDAASANCEFVHSELEIVTNQLALLSPDSENWRGIQHLPELDEYRPDNRQPRRDSSVARLIDKFSKMSVTTTPATIVTETPPVTNNGATELIVTRNDWSCRWFSMGGSPFRWTRRWPWRRPG